METWAFKPLYGPSTGIVQGSLLSSTTVAASTSAAASTRFQGGPSGGSICQIQIANQTNGWAFVNFGNLDIGAVTAATVASGYPVAPGGVVVVSVGDDVNGASVILASGSTSGNVTFTRGVGL
jgi:hypothetical protein